MLGRLVHRADFERLLASPPLSRSAHFAMHHAEPGAIVPTAGAAGAGAAELSTPSAPTGSKSVDKSVGAVYFGLVVPKRHARRAVMRNLIKRLGREVMRQHLAALPKGLWLLRLRSGWPAGAFVSARSTALARLLRAELERLVRAALQRQQERDARGAAA